MQSQQFLCRRNPRSFPGQEERFAVAACCQSIAKKLALQLQNGLRILSQCFDTRQTRPHLIGDTIRETPLKAVVLHAKAPRATLFKKDPHGPIHIRVGAALTNIKIVELLLGEE